MAVESTLLPVCDSLGATWLRNPALPVQAKGLVLFVLDRGDQALTVAGERTNLNRAERRVAHLVLGAAATKGGSDAQVDELHFAARSALRDWSKFRDIGLQSVSEAQVEPELKETDVDGVLLLSAFDVTYLEKYPA